MSKTLYVGNLPWRTTEDELRDFFSERVSVQAVRIITDRMTGRSKGFGFIEVSDEDAELAIREFNGKDLEGRALVVDEARERTM